MTYEFFISWRYLKARRKQVFIPVISLISIAGIAVGVCALIVTLSVMNGFRKDLRERIVGMTSHIVVLDQRNIGLDDVEEAQNRIAQIESVMGVAPFVYGQAILKSTERSCGVVVKGVIPEKAKKVASLLEKLKEGSMDSLEMSEKEKNRTRAQEKGIVLGSELAKNLGVYIGMDVIMISPKDVVTRIGMVPRMERFRVVGIFDSGMYEYDANLAYIFLPVAQKLFDMEGRVTGLEVRVRDVFHADEIASMIQNRLGYPYWARSWMVMYKNLFSALKLEKVTMFIILVLIVLVAAFNIISTLMMMTMEKTKDIGILKAMGATKSGILRVFLFQGLIMGVVGATGGVVLGYLISSVLAKYQFIKLPQDVYYINRLPVYMQAGDFFYVTLVAITISLLATVYPAYRAACLDPCEAIRYE